MWSYRTRSGKHLKESLWVCSGCMSKGRYTSHVQTQHQWRKERLTNWAWAQCREILTRVEATPQTSTPRILVLPQGNRKHSKTHLTPSTLHLSTSTAQHGPAPSTVSKSISTEHKGYPPLGLQSQHQDFHGLAGCQWLKSCLWFPHLWMEMKPPSYEDERRQHRGKLRTVILVPSQNPNDRFPSICLTISSQAPLQARLWHRA